MTTDSASAPAPSRSNLRWWRDWLGMSLIAVFVISLIAAHLPPSLMKIVIFPIGVCVVGGLAIRKCGDLAGNVFVDTPSAHVGLRLAVAALLLAGLAHTYWLVFDRYLDDARADRKALQEERNERAQVVQALEHHGEQLDQVGVAVLLQPLPPLPTFVDYLRQRMSGDHLPHFLTTTPWPFVVFGLEVAIAVFLGAWFALEGTINRPHVVNAGTRGS